jgi:hypothetical protein
MDLYADKDCKTQIPSNQLPPEVQASLVKKAGACQKQDGGSPYYEIIINDLARKNGVKLPALPGGDGDKTDDGKKDDDKVDVTKQYGNRIPCPSPVAELVMYFLDEKCEKQLPGQTYETMKRNATKYTQEISKATDKCNSIDGKTFVQIKCYEKGALYTHIYTDKECKTEIPTSSLSQVQ